MARDRSQSVFNRQTKDLVRQAGLVSFGVTLPDLYIDLILSKKLRYREAARAYMTCLTEYNMDDRAVH